MLGVSGAYIGIKFGLMYLMKFVFDVRETAFIEEMKIIVGFFMGQGFLYRDGWWILGKDGISIW